MIIILKPTIILLQETMMEGTKAKEVLEPWLKDRNFAYIISDGHSWGLVIAWSPGFIEIMMVKHNRVIKTVLKEKCSRESYDFYNVYGPYQNEKAF